MDVTNPGLVSIADQAYPPALGVPASAVPEDSKILVPVADDAELRPENDVGASVFPTPTDAPVALQPPPELPQDLGVPIPDLPDVDVASQSFGKGAMLPGGFGSRFVPPAEHVVSQLRQNIQTNTTEETEKDFTVTGVLDADTLGPPVGPTPVLSGTFVAVGSGGAGIIVLSSPAATGLTAGDLVSITGSTEPSYDGVRSVSNVVELAGTFAAVGNTGGNITLVSTVPLPVGLVSGQRVLISGSSVPAYDGVRAISAVVNISGTFAQAFDAGGGSTRFVSSTALSVSLLDGQHTTISGSSVPAYDGVRAISNVTNEAGSFTSVAASATPGDITFTSAAPIPAAIVVGKIVAVTGIYAGTYAVTAVGANTFDVTAVFSATDAGTWNSYSFDMAVAFAGTATGTWTAYTFDMAVAFSATATGSWSAYTFEMAVPFVVTATGSWAQQNPFVEPTTRYMLILAPATLTSQGVSLLGREVLFAEDTLTVADRGAVRIITGLGANFVAIDKDDPDDDVVPSLADPQVGDVITIDTERQGAEDLFEEVAAPEEVLILPPPPDFVPNPSQAINSQGNVDVSTGPQPGDPIVTSGIGAPPSIDVNVKDQSTSVGLPTDVFV